MRFDGVLMIANHGRWLKFSCRQCFHCPETYATILASSYNQILIAWADCCTEHRAIVPLRSATKLTCLTPPECHRAICAARDNSLGVTWIKCNTMNALVMSMPVHYWHCIPYIPQQEFRVSTCRHKPRAVCGESQTEHPMSVATQDTDGHTIFWLPETNRVVRACRRHHTVIRCILDTPDGICVPA